MPGRRVEHVGREAGAFVGGQRPRVVGQDFERQLAAAELPRPLFGPVQQRLTDPLPAPIIAGDDVVDVEQGFGGEGGKAGEAVDQADRLVAIEGQRAVEGGQVFQFIDQIALA